jgi:hypothetical protein
VSPGFARCLVPADRRQRSRDEPSPTHFSFEPFPKSADLSKKRAVPNPPLPQRKPRFPQGGVFAFRTRSGAVSGRRAIANAGETPRRRLVPPKTGF